VLAKSLLKTAFHYSSQLRTWSKTWSQAGSKHAESLLRTCLIGVFVIRSICLARARTSETAAVRDQVFDKKVESWSKACRKPTRTCRKPGCKRGRKRGLYSQVCSWLKWNAALTHHTNSCTYKKLAIANRSRVSCAHVEGIYDNPVTFKSLLTVIQAHWKRNYCVDHTRLTISRVIGR